MPLLAGLLGTLFSTLFTQLAVYFTKRVAAFVALTATVAAAGAAVWIAVKALIATIVVATPDAVAIAAGWIIPANLPLCIAATVGTEFALAGYRWARDNARAAASIS